MHLDWYNKAPRKVGPLKQGHIFSVWIIRRFFYHIGLPSKNRQKYAASGRMRRGRPGPRLSRIQMRRSAATNSDWQRRFGKPSARSGPPAASVRTGNGLAPPDGRYLTGWDGPYGIAGDERWTTYDERVNGDVISLSVCRRVAASESGRPVGCELCSVSSFS